MTRPYYGTSVSIEDTQMDIQNLLCKYNAARIHYAFRQQVIILTCALKIEGNQHKLVFRVPVYLPLPKNKKKDSKKISAKQKKIEQAAWRSLFWTLKSLLESIELKMQIESEVFMQSEKLN